MTMRRHSRTPAVLTHDQQVTLVRAADQNENLQKTVETLVGKPWGTLTFQQKIAAVHETQEVGYAMGSLAGAARGIRDAENAAEQIRHGVSTEDRLALIEEQNSVLKEKLAAAESQLRVTRQALTVKRAEKARAVHSGGSR